MRKNILCLGFPQSLVLEYPCVRGRGTLTFWVPGPPSRLCSASPGLGGTQPQGRGPGQLAASSFWCEGPGWPASRELCVSTEDRGGWLRVESVTSGSGRLLQSRHSWCWWRPG